MLARLGWGEMDHENFNNLLKDLKETLMQNSNRNSPHLQHSGYHLMNVNADQNEIPASGPTSKPLSFTRRFFSIQSATQVIAK